MVVEPSLTIQPVDFEHLLVLIGTVSGTPWSWSWPEGTPSDQLPEFDITGVTSEGETITIPDVKFGSCRITASRGNPIEVTFDGVSIGEITYATAALSNTPPSTARLMYLDACAAVGSGGGTIDSITIELSKELEPRRSVECSGGRYATEIIEKMKSVRFDATIEVTDKYPWTEHKDVDTAKTVSLTVGDAVLTITGCLYDDLSFEEVPDGEVKTVSLTGTGLGFTAVENV
ncbi:MAG: hypothetical protein PHZ19_09455 [Candidatus Thermoplasmatota archaeon]|nr:hypothetical protein [Candidatus Thermoplasmatota archaeon]